MFIKTGMKLQMENSNNLLLFDFNLQSYTKKNLETIKTYRYLIIFLSNF